MIIKGSMNYDQFGRKLKRKGKLRSSSQVRTTACRAVSKGSNPLRSAKKPCSTKEEFLERLKSFRVILHQKQIGNLKKVENILWLQHTTREPIKLYLKMK